MKLIFPFILTLFSSSVIAQQSAVNRDAYNLRMESTTEEIILDGVFDEAFWQNAQKTTPFHKVTPVDEGFPISPSEVKMVRSNNHFYIAITCFDTIPGKRPVESLRRDFSFGRNDNFIVFIDTYNDQTNGFAFGISAAGAQWEGIQADGGFVSLNWDTKWKSAVKNYDDRWTAEFVIPYKSIRYKNGDTQWGINFSRLDLKTGEKSAWAPVPRQFQTANLAFTGTLEWKDPLPERKVNYSFIPYIFAKSTKDNINDKGDLFTPKIGADAKVTLSTSVNLDLTLNPDFSQVDVDQQQINLDRFELFFPERRQFFLENSDLFASLGHSETRPFFSRRIGLQNPVAAGARLSGKVGKRSRIGIMNMQTRSNEFEKAHNFTVGVYQQQFLARSNATFFMVNKQLTGEANSTESKYNRTTGVDFNLASADNKWTGKIYYHQSLYEGVGKDAFTASGTVVYFTPKMAVAIGQSYIGEDYNAEVGFVRRTGVYRFVPEFLYRWFPKNSKIVSHGINASSKVFLDKSFALRDRASEFNYSFTWQDRSTLILILSDDFINLRKPFDPTNSGGNQLPADSNYNWQGAGAKYVSNPKNLLSYGLFAGYGGYFNGTRLDLEAEAAYRVQPFGYLGILASVSNIDLPTPYNSAKYYLIGPKLDITFTDKIFLTTFTQYNNQIDNLNVNVRFQWRFAPGSDFFLVYSQNTFQDDFRLKNRGLVAKASYWIN